jgi:hypothetical protein
MANTAVSVAATTSSERIACFIGNLPNPPASRNAAASPLDQSSHGDILGDNLAGQ